MAAERLGRRWAGCDIWNLSAHRSGAVTARVRSARSSLRRRNGRLLTFGERDVHDRASRCAPMRNRSLSRSCRSLSGTRIAGTAYRADAADGRPSESLSTARNGKLRPGVRRPRARLAASEPQDTPRADGGINHITNRVLLCGDVCNRTKAHTAHAVGFAQTEPSKAATGWPTQRPLALLLPHH